MTAPLYDIKARFSEYVTMAENGEVVEITKHGTTTAVIISLKMFNELNDEYQEMHRPSFVDEVR
ncbi:MAG: type II toxin-antitoxin system prevent-host-death family antitoxin, partial [Treponema sp.]|nr:type II toxin-antitoxin system prevent-host-death family antitoxin [Treponema sp.]